MTIKVGIVLSRHFHKMKMNECYIFILFEFDDRGRKRLRRSSLTLGENLTSIKVTVDLDV